MLGIDPNDLGERGEILFHLAITELDGRSHSRFRPRFMGEKWPAVDFVVELRDVAGLTPFFFVQVKATTNRYTAKKKRLIVRADEQDITGLASYPAPVYIAGVDIETETVYLVSATGKTNRLASLSTEFPLNATNRNILWQEVKEYWQQVNRYAGTVVPQSHFVDNKWR